MAIIILEDDNGWHLLQMLEEELKVSLFADRVE